MDYGTPYMRGIVRMTPDLAALVEQLRSYDKHNHRGQYAKLIHKAAAAIESLAAENAELLPYATTMRQIVEIRGGKKMGPGCGCEFAEDESEIITCNYHKELHQRAERAEAERDLAAQTYAYQKRKIERLQDECAALRQDAERNEAIAKLAQNLASQLIREAQRAGDAMFVIFANARGKQYNTDLAAIDAALANPAAPPSP